MTYIEEYLDAAHSGRVDVPKYVIKQYEMLLPIIKGQDTRWMYDPAKAHKPIEFAENFASNQRTSGSGNRLDIYCGKRQRSRQYTASSNVGAAIKSTRRCL